MGYPRLDPRAGLPSRPLRGKHLLRAGYRADGTELILDAGTGIRDLGAALGGSDRRLHVLLTHLHLDHIQGLMFFAPLFDRRVEVTIWGPPGAGRTLRERLARYISNPLSPIEIRELPAKVTFKDTPPAPWRIGNVEVKASLVSHRGPTLGYRLTEERASVCYLPDHEPRLGENLSTARANWISGHALARDASLLIHDYQYAEGEYGAHRGWGHSSLPETLAFARRCEPHHVLLFTTTRHAMTPSSKRCKPRRSAAGPSSAASDRSRWHARAG